jgi:ethanolamine utilization protein EutA
VALKWEGSATYQRIDSFCKGIIGGMKGHTAKGHPIVMVFEGDVGGLLGIHMKQELLLETPVISIDGVELREFDFIDIGEIIPTSGAVPVVIKSLVFPTGASAPRLGA